MTADLGHLRHHVSGAVDRGEASAIAETPVPADPSLTLRVDRGRTVTLSPLSPSATIYYRREGGAAEQVAVSHVVSYQPGDQTGDRVPITETIIGTVTDFADLLGDADRAAHLLEVGRLGQHDEWMVTR